MTKQNPGLNGQNGSQPRWEITQLHRVSMDPVAWRGNTADGIPVHLSYRHGILRIEVAEPSREHPGHHSWRELLAIRPDYVELELDLLRRRGNPMLLAPDASTSRRREQQVVADWLALGECKSDRRKPVPRMSFARLRSVLQMREENLDYLRRVGIAGTSARIVVTAFLEGPPQPGARGLEEAWLFFHRPPAP